MSRGLGDVYKRQPRTLPHQTLRMPKIPMFLYQDNLILVFRGCRCGHLAFTLSSEGFLYENTPNVFFHSTSFLGKILPGFSQAGDFF